MKLLICLLILLSCANEYVVNRKVNTCVTSDKFPEAYIIMKQWGWDIWLKEAGVENARTMRYVNDKKWRAVECPK